jgi:Zn ribbon nucleic-acid-binding protein
VELGADQAWEENQIELFNTLATGYIYGGVQKKVRRTALAS